MKCGQRWNPILVAVALGKLRSQLLGCVSKKVLGSMAAVLGYLRTWMACVYQECPHTRFTVVPAPGIQGSG